MMAQERLPASFFCWRIERNMIEEERIHTLLFVDDEANILALRWLLQQLTH